MIPAIPTTWTDRAFGDGGRVGYIAPSTAERVAREFYEAAPADLALLIATLSITRVTQDEVDAARTGILAAAQQLTATGADMVYTAGLPLALAGGIDAERALRSELEDATGLPCMTDLINIFRAFQAMSLEKIVLVSPFPEETNERIARVFATSGTVVLGSHGYDMDRQRDYQRLPYGAPAEGIERALSEHPDADGVFVACGRFGYVEHVSDWEKRFGLPMLLGNQLMIWWALGLLDRRPINDDCGSLFRVPAIPDSS